MFSDKWDKLLDEGDPIKRKILAKLLKNEAEYLKKLSDSKIGPFQKFVFPVIRRAYPSLIGGDSRPEDTPLKKLTEQALAKHHPDDPDWEEWKKSVKDRVGDIVVKNTTRGLDEEAEELPPALKAELDNLHLFEPPAPAPAPAPHPIVSVQPMTQPVGCIAFYRPRYASSNPDKRGETVRSGRWKPKKKRNFDR